MAAAIVVCVTGCSTTVPGALLSGFADPFRVAGIPAEDGPSGIRDNAPAPTGTVENTDGGQIDRLVLLSLNDIADYWTQNYSDTFKGRFTPVGTLLSYDANDPASPDACGGATYDLVNAFFCGKADLIAWDRGVMIPVTEKFFGDIAVTAILAHEYGHAVQAMADLTDRSTPTLVREQQADCFAGAYIRWVAEGNSKRLRVSTGDGLNHVLAGAVFIRDPIEAAVDPSGDDNAHGSALDRVGAFQKGFSSGPGACAVIDMDEITARRGDLPTALQTRLQDLVASTDSTQTQVDEGSLDSLLSTLKTVLPTKNPPTLSTDAPPCETGGSPTTYCAETNTIYTDMPALEKLGKPADEDRDFVLLQGPNSVWSAVASRYALAAQREKGLPMDTAATALRTACLTGYTQRQMAQDAGAASSNDRISLTGYDIDAAISGLLTNGIVASSADGATVPAGFTRVTAFRAGLLSTAADTCYQRFPA